MIQEVKMNALQEMNERRVHSWELALEGSRWNGSWFIVQLTHQRRFSQWALHVLQSDKAWFADSIEESVSSSASFQKTKMNALQEPSKLRIHTHGRKLLSVHTTRKANISLFRHLCCISTSRESSIESEHARKRKRNYLSNTESAKAHKKRNGAHFMASTKHWIAEETDGRFTH